MNPHEVGIFLLGFTAGAWGIVVLLLLFRLIRPWIRAFLAGGRVSLVDILRMGLLGSPPSLLIDAYVGLLHSGIRVTIAQIESVFLANKGLINTPQNLMTAVQKVIEKQPDSPNKPLQQTGPA
jgi:uncharacterized protein YqfA (UPF0365 family)